MRRVETKARSGASGSADVPRRRALACLAAGLLGGLALAACAPGSLRPGRASGPGTPSAVTLRVAVPTNPLQGVPAFWRDVVAKAGAGAGLALQAVPTPWGQSTPAASGTPTYDLGLGLAAALAGGDPTRPAVLVLNGITVAPLAQAKLIVVLDDLIAADRQFQSRAFLPGMLELGRWRGRQVAFPIGEVPSALGYVPAAFQKAGVAPPAVAQDRAEFAALVAKLAKAGEVGFQPSIWACWQFLLADGVPVVNPDGRTSGLGGSAAVQSLTDLSNIRAAARPASPPPPGLAASTITLASMSLGNGFYRAFPYRFAEPPRGKTQATRVDALNGVAMTSGVADRSAAFRALLAVQEAAEAFALLSARVGSGQALPGPTPTPAATTFRSPEAAELRALRATAQYGRAVPADVSIAVNSVINTFLRGALHRSRILGVAVAVIDHRGRWSPVSHRPAWSAGGRVGLPR